MASRGLRIGWLLFALSACRTGHEERKVEAATIPARDALAAPARVPVIEDRGLERFLTRHGVQGVVALLDDDAQTARCSDLARCEQPFVPASTFKIPNSIIGLETGVIPNADFELPWDGVERPIPAWNHDHTLRTALRDSAVWYYQELARRVGKDRMQVWLHKLAYGNEQSGDRIDRFWLDGPLAVRPVEQLEFLRRLARKRLPISARTRDIVLEITQLGELDGKILRGKTGWAQPHQPNEIGWFVGFTTSVSGSGVESYRYVAVLLFKTDPEVDFLPLRRLVAEQALRDG